MTKFETPAIITELIKCDVLKPALGCENVWIWDQMISTRGEDSIVGIYCDYEAAPYPWSVIVGVATGEEDAYETVEEAVAVAVANMLANKR